MLDAMNGLLGQSDFVRELILAEAKDRPRRTQLGGKRHPLDTHDMVEL